MKKPEKKYKHWWAKDKLYNLGNSEDPHTKYPPKTEPCPPSQHQEKYNQENEGNAER